MAASNPLSRLRVPPLMGSAGSVADQPQDPQRLQAALEVSMVELATLRNSICQHRCHGHFANLLQQVRHRQQLQQQPYQSALSQVPPTQGVGGVDVLSRTAVVMLTQLLQLPGAAVASAPVVPSQPPTHVGPLSWPFGMQTVRDSLITPRQRHQLRRASLPGSFGATPLSPEQRRSRLAPRRASVPDLTDTGIVGPADRFVHARYAQYVMLHAELDQIRFASASAQLLELWAHFGMPVRGIRLATPPSLQGMTDVAQLALTLLRSQLAPGQLENRVTAIWDVFASAFRRLHLSYVRRDLVEAAMVEEYPSPGLWSVPGALQPNAVAIPALVIREQWYAGKARAVAALNSPEESGAALLLCQMALSSAETSSPDSEFSVDTFGSPDSDAMEDDLVLQDDDDDDDDNDDDRQLTFGRYLTRDRPKPSLARPRKRQRSARPSARTLPVEADSRAISDDDSSNDMDAALFAPVITRSGRRSRVLRAERKQPESPSEEDEVDEEDSGSPRRHRKQARRRPPPSRAVGSRGGSGVLSPASRWRLFEENRKARASGGAGKRALPEKAVERLKQWFLEHFDDPYPDDDTKMRLAEETGLTVKQVNYWFINSRVRVWKPMTQATGGEGPRPPARRNRAVVSSSSPSTASDEGLSSPDMPAEPEPGEPSPTLALRPIGDLPPLP